MRCLAVFAGARFGLSEAPGFRIRRLQPLGRLAPKSLAAGQFSLGGLHCLPGMLRGVVALGKLLALLLRGLPFLLQLLAARLPGGQLFLRLPCRVVGLRGGGSCLFGGGPPLAQLPCCLRRVSGECRDAGERSQRTGHLGGEGPSSSAGMAASSSASTACRAHNADSCWSIRSATAASGATVAARAAA